MEFNASEVAQFVCIRLPNLRKHGEEWRGGCPIHGGKDANFVIYASGVAQCHSQCAEDWDLLGLEMAMTGLDFMRAKDSVFRLIGRAEPTFGERDFVSVYDYTDAAGVLSYQCIRKTPDPGTGKKRFTQRRPDGVGGWIWSVKDLERLPFELPKLCKAKVVYCVEGEKDVHTLERWGLAATCNSEGAGCFKPELVQYFADKTVYIIPDNDEPGRQHALRVAEMLSGTALSVKIVELPGLPEKGDVSDWAKRKGTAKHLQQIADAASEWSLDWQFAADIPWEEAKYFSTLEEQCYAAGGMDAFWDLTGTPGIPTPWPKLTETLNGGMIPGEVYVVGGNKKSGKTSLALQFAIAAMQSGNGVLMFSMEMNWRQMFQRLVAIDARVDLRRLRADEKAGFNVDVELMRLRDSQHELEKRSLVVCQRAAITPDYLVAAVTRLKAQGGVDLVIVDHMQLMGELSKTRSEYEKFTAISRALKTAAKEANVPVLLISQCSRRNSADKQKELESSDLRGTGAIEEDAAAVMLIYPDAQDARDAEGTPRYSLGPVKAWLKVDLNRYGASGVSLCLDHWKQYARFDLPPGNVGNEKETASD